MSNHQEHEYLRDTIASTYKECISCNIRTQFICVKCGYCYSCHWKKEELEKVESEGDNSLIVKKIPQPIKITVEQPSTGQMVMDVFGQHIEPICNYRTCSHKFSEHGRTIVTCQNQDKRTRAQGHKQLLRIPYKYDGGDDAEI